MISRLATFDELAGGCSLWDALIVGAGPAGSIAAICLARTGKRVLLVEKATFPRWKVCGGCLNRGALEVISRLGITQVLGRSAAQQLNELALVCQGRQARLRLPGNVAINRALFDAALADQAVAAGATLITGVTARPGIVAEGHREVRLNIGHEHDRTAKAKVVIVAAGLNGWHSVTQPHRATDGRIGAGALLSHSPDFVAPGSVQMAVGHGGYVGAVRLADGRVDVAAAFDRSFFDDGPGMASAVGRILKQANLACPAELDDVVWTGTPQLTRRAEHVADHRLFVIGDAAGYVEPFTGEGMAWAMRGGEAVAPIAMAAIDSYGDSLPSAWELQHRRLLAHRMGVCSAVSRLLRQPLTVGVAVRVLSRAPWLAQPLLRNINRG